MPPEIDEGARRRFEAARSGYSSVHLSDFLPAREDPRYAATLEELLCIELEFAWKAWSSPRPPPELETWFERFPELRSTPAAERLAEEALLLRGTYYRESSDSGGTGRHELLEEIGRGTFARVFRARDPRLKRFVAVKVLRAEYLADERMRERFQREAQSAAHLHHPGIVQVFDVGEQDGKPFIASELIEGPTLEERLVDGPPPPRVTAEWIARLCDALDYAHRCGIVHRDVKPENVLTTAGGELLISDFGLALQQEEESGLTRHGDLLGTPAYMSPEQASGEGRIDARCDIYSLGVVLYRALCGKLPFEGSWSSILRRVVSEEPVPPRRRLAGVPADLETICLTAMAKEPERRYSTAAAMAADLRRFLALEPIHARRPTVFQSLRLWCRRNPALASTIGVAVLLVTLIASFSMREIVRQRDEAIASEYDALVDGARASLEARTTGWWKTGLEKLKKARALDSPRVDVTALRELATEYLATAAPSFHERVRWGRGKAEVTEVAIDVHGRLAACGRENGELDLRSVFDGRALAELRLTGEVAGLDFHFGESLLVGFGDQGLVRCYDVASLEANTVGFARDAPAKELPLLFERSFGARIRALACSPVGGRTALALEDGRLLLFDDWTAEAPAHAMKSGAVVIDLRFSPDGRYFISCHEKGDVVVWDAEARVAVDLYSVGEEVASVDLDERGRELMAITTWDGILRRNHETGYTDKATRGETHEGSPTSVRVGGDWVFSAARDGGLKAMDGGLHAKAEVMVAHNPILVLDVDARGRFLIAGHADGTSLLWEFSEPSERVYFRGSHGLAFRRGRWLVRHDMESSFEAGLESGIQDVRTYQLPSLDALVSVGGDGAFACGFGRRVASGPCGFEKGEIALVAADGTRRRWAAYEQHGLSVLAADAWGERLASVSTAGELKVWDLEQQEAEVTIELEMGRPNLLSWYDDQTRLLVGSDTDLYQVSLETEDIVATRFPWSGPATLIGGRIAVGDERGVVEIHDLVSAERLTALEAFDEPVTALFWHSVSNTLIAAARDGQIRSWRGPSWEPGTQWRVGGFAPLWLAVDRDSRYLAVGGGPNASATLFEFESGRGLVRMWHPRLTCGAFSTDGRELFLGSAMGAAIAIELADVEEYLREEVEVGATDLDPSPRPYGKARTVLIGGHTWNVWGLAASPDGEHVATCAHDGTVNLWSGDECLRLDWSVDAHEDVAWSVSFDQASERVASTSLDVKVWSVADGTELLRLPSQERLSTCSVFLSTRPWLVTGTLDGAIRVWDLGTGAKLAEPRSAPSPPIHNLALDPRGRWLAAACGDGTVLVWERFEEGDLERGPDRILRWSSSSVEIGDTAPIPVWAVCFDPVGECLATADEDGGVSLWRTSDWEQLSHLQCGTRRLRALSFSGDGELLAVGTYIHESMVWDLGEVRRSLGELGLGW